MSLRRRAVWTWMAQAHATRNSPAPFLYQTYTLTKNQPRPSNFRSQSSSSYSTSDSLKSSSIDSQTQAEEGSSIGSSSKFTGEDSQPFATNPTPAPRRTFLRRKAETIQPVAKEQRWQKKERPDKLGQKPRLTTHETRTLAGLISKLDPEKHPIPQGLAQKPGKSEEPGPAEPEDVNAEISKIFETVLKDVRNLQGPPEHRAGGEKPWSPWVQERERLERGSLEEQDIKGQSMEMESLEKEAGQSLDTTAESPGQPQAGDALQAQNSQLKLTDKELEELLRTDQITLARAIEVVTAREAAKIDSALHLAVEGTKDKQFWKVCQDKVFSLAQHLRSNNGVASASLSESESESDSDSDFSVPAGVPTDLVVSQIYPKVLRLAFVLLNLHFPESRFLNQFRAKITSLGPESVALGFTKGLINDMIYVHWRVTHDIPEVIALCREMEVTGVHPNDATCGMLEAIVRERNEDIAQRQAGNVSQQPWWDFPENRRAVRMLIGEDGMIARLRRHISEGKSRKSIYKPYL